MFNRKICKKHREFPKEISVYIKKITQTCIEKLSEVPLSGHTTRLQVWSLVGVCTGGNLSMFLSHFDASLSLSLK